MTALRDELRQAGASEHEARELDVLARKLRQLPLTSIDRLYGFRWTKFLALSSILTSAGLALVLILVFTAQAALPGSALFPVQQFSDAAIVKIHPAYQEMVMMKRARQVKQLVQRRADTSSILAALADYKVAAQAYHAYGDDYAAYDYCKTNLRQAVAEASGSTRQAINHVLASLDDV